MSRRLRLLSVFLTIAMVFGSLCIPAGAISFQVGDTIGTGTVQTAENLSITSDGKVTYAKATYTDSKNLTQTVHALEFNPKTSDYMPYVYSRWTGVGCDTYRSALNAESQFGADVIAGVNATFYSLDTGSTYAGYWVHDGRLAQASAGYQNDIITFFTDGTYNVVNSKLDFKVYINGLEITYGGGGSIAHINKKSLSSNVSDKFYYWDTECGTKTDSVIPGTEILCKKLDFGQLTIGGTLKGEVKEIRTNTYNQPVGADEFVLYVKNGSPLMEKISSVTVGSIIEISVIETIEAARPYTEKANAAIAAQYPIVKNGKADTAEALSQLGADFMNARAQRTSIGFKADGSIVLVCTAGREVNEVGLNGLTVYELADLMVQLGCVTAYNFDGGNSTTMITQKADGSDFDIRIRGNEGTYGRNVANSFYIVRKQSSSNSDGVKAALAALIDANKDNTSQPVQEAIAEANAVLANTKSMDGDYTRVYMKLKLALSGKAELDSAIASVAGISYKDYSPTVLQMIWDAYNTAVSVRANENATTDEITQITKQLNSLLQLKGDVSVNISRNKSYVTAGAPHDGAPDAYKDTNFAELTDGVIAPQGNLIGSEWVCFHNSKKAGTDDGAPYYDVTINLGSSAANLTEFKVYTEHVWSYGIEAPIKVVVSVSEDGQTFTDVGFATSDLSASLVRSDADKNDSSKKETTDIVFTLKLTEGVKGQYVRFRLVGGKTKTMMFVTELEVYKSDKPVDQAIFVTGMNAKINTNDSIIFTPDYATDLNGNNANLNWAFAIAAQWDDAKKAYVVVQTASGNGSNAIKTVPQNGFVLGVHGDSGDGAANKAYASKIKVGDIIVLNGIDIASKTMLPGSYVQYYTPAASDATLKPGSSIKLENGYATGIRNETTVTALQNQFNGTIVVKDAKGNVITGNQLVGTGATINTGSTVYTVVVKGDLDGDGLVDSVDALLLKRGIIGTTTLSALQLKAGIFDNSTEPSATDYLILKRYILGTQDIYAN